MKKKIIALVLTAILATGACFAAEELEIFTYLYDAATTPTDQLGILQSVSEMRLQGIGSLYARAIARLVREYPSIRDINEKSNADELAVLLAGVLGNEKQVSAAPDLWRAVTAFPNPLVKSEAMMALGKMRATAFLPQIVQTLSDLNTRPATDRLAGERIAFGAILALEKYQDPSGYLPVFFASTGWYSERIKSQATAALPLILADPTDQMLQVVKGSGYPPSTKLVALRNIEAAKVSNQSKSNVAVAALTAGWTVNVADTRQRMDLVTLRKEAMTMIGKYGSNDPGVYQQLANSYNRGVDLQEKLAAIQTLTAINTEEAAAQLNNFLAALNRKQKSGGVTQEENNLVRAIIPAMGTLRKSSSRGELMTVLSSNWPAAVNTLAENAAKNIR
jgi:hypothetical protein